MTVRDVVIALMFLVIGWCAHLLWDWFTEWLYDTTGVVRSFLWDVCAWLGVAAVCLGVGWAVTR